MKKNLLLFIVLLGVVGCSDNDYSGYSYNDNTIYSVSDNNQFTEIIGFISPYLLHNGEKKYILVENLTDIQLSINQIEWETRKSYSIDTEKIKNKELIDDYWVTSEKIVYPVVINIRPDSDKLTTAGQYASLINNYYSLPPGVYVCHLESFCLTSTTGTTERINMPATFFFALEVKTNEVSANMGEFEVLIQ